MSKQFHTIETVATIKKNVHAIWSTDSKDPQPITPDLLIPNGYIELIFVRNGSYKKRKLSGKHPSFVVNQSVIVGIQDKVIMSQNIGELNSIGLQFDPMYFYLLFGDLGVTICNEHLPISESGQNELIKLSEKILKTVSIAEAFKEIETFFIDYNPKIVRCETWELTKNCLQYLRSQKGNTTIENIAKNGKVNINTLSANFKKFIGFSPKEMKSIIKTTSNYTEPSLNTSENFLSIENLFKDINENDKGK